MEFTVTRHPQGLGKQPNGPPNRGDAAKSGKASVTTPTGG